MEYTSSEVPASFKITVRQLVREVGLTHASSVMEPARCSELASLTVTQLLEPLKDRALPYRPGAQVAAMIVPLFPVPDASAAVEPVPSSKLNAATRVFVVETVTLTPAAGVSRLALSSTARLLMTAAPPMVGAQV